MSNKIKIDVEHNSKMMIIEYNALNEISFSQSDLGSYKVMVSDLFPTNASQDQNEEPKVLVPKSEIVA